MQVLARNVVSVLLAILAVALIYAYSVGGGQGDEATANAAPVDSTAAVVRSENPRSENRAPSINVEAGAYARVGAPYELKPEFNDADRDELTFSANNLPPWAKLDPKTGRVLGTPNAGDVGEYESIVITVADATHVAKTREFAITVLPPITGVASLQWEVPASRLDGTLLDDLAGYRILYGRSPEDLDHSVFIAGAEANTYELADLESGIWYFAVAAVRANGLEGPPSTPSMKSI
jgi:hypothetical protein